MLIITTCGHKQYTEIEQIQQTLGAEFLRLLSEGEHRFPPLQTVQALYLKVITIWWMSGGLKCKKNIHVNRWVIPGVLWYGLTRKTIDSIIYLKLKIMLYLQIIALLEWPELVSGWSLFGLNCRSKCCPSRHAAQISISRSMFYILSLQTGFKSNCCPAWVWIEFPVTNCKTPTASATLQLLCSHYRCLWIPLERNISGRSRHAFIKLSICQNYVKFHFSDLVRH